MGDLQTNLDRSSFAVEVGCTFAFGRLGSDVLAKHAPIKNSGDRRFGQQRRLTS